MTPKNSAESLRGLSFPCVILSERDLANERRHVEARLEEHYFGPCLLDWTALYPMS